LVAVNVGVTALEYVNAIGCNLTFNANATFNAKLTFLVDQLLAFVDANTYLKQTATAFIMSTDSAAALIRNTTVDGTISFNVKDGSGTYDVIILDPSDLSINLNNEHTLKHGYLNAYPLSAGEIGYHIENITNNFYIENTANGFNTIFRNDNAGGTPKTTLTLDPDTESAKMMGCSFGFKTVTASSDNESVLGIGTMFIDSTAGAVTLGGLSDGYAGQIVRIVHSVHANAVTLEHLEGTGDEKFAFPSVGDEALALYEGVTLVNHAGTTWIPSSWNL